HLKGWNEHWPAQAFCVGALAVALLALILSLSRAGARRDPVVRFLVVAVVLWPVLRYGMTFWIEGLSRADHHTGLLSVYMRYLLLRCELLLLFACLCAACARLFLVLDRGRGRWRPVAAAGGVAACWLLPALGLLTPVEVSGFPVIPTVGRFPVTEDELKMAAWVAENVPPEKGMIGLAALTFTVGKG